MTFKNRIMKITFIYSCILIYGSSVLVTPKNLPAKISRPELFGSEHLKLYKNIKSKYNAPGEENIVTSPFVFNIGMGILRSAAPKICEKSLSSIPGMSKGDGSNLTVVLYRIAMRTKNNNTILELSNSVYLDDRQTLKKHVATRLKVYYQTNLYKVDFAHNASLIEIQINKNISRETHGLINEALSPGTLDTTTQSLIISTMYFEAKWTTPFERFEKQTFKGKKKSSSVTMLSGTDDYEIITLANGRKLIIKEYYSDPQELSNKSSKDDKFIFVVSQGEESIIDATNLLSGATQERKNIRLTMPKIKQTTDLNVLDKFSNETQCLNSHGLIQFTEKALNILSVKQKNRFETTLAGSKGASVFISIGFRYLRPQNVEELLIDEPFNYYVIHKQTGAVLFAGTYIEPDTTIDALDE